MLPRRLHANLEVRCLLNVDLSSWRVAGVLLGQVTGSLSRSVGYSSYSLGRRPSQSPRPWGLGPVEGQLSGRLAAPSDSGSDSDSEPRQRPTAHAPGFFGQLKNIFPLEILPSLALRKMAENVGMPEISRLPQATKKSAEGETIQGRHAKHPGHEWE